MARLQFTAQLRRFTDTPDVEVDAPDLATALDAAFALNPRLRGYVLDDQGQLRPNVAAFVDGTRTLNVNHALQPHSQVHVLQALSGG
ncbi:MoaD/ThiS family protein [Inhella crocodyli]|jgi:molybdopterin synthase sulfur carrier subunit|uniref:MoaD/ThiS family protein n=1 Tax=Inhella crocodyli TaxID=2499851 RepID=A0A437LTA2_9BURK|nr:MoaD/ThiS family protein [Inhella crocodyli]RVT88646.1 MoaD/ThiS family protein [Inhella crocodyli]